jgi:phosphoglycolate phosphatase-like HAD superfamily hydrolase
MPVGFSLSSFKAVLFDVDGTLVDSLSGIVQGIGDTCERFLGHRPSNEIVRSLVGRPLKDQFQILADAPISPEQSQSMVDFAVQRFHDHCHRDPIFQDAVTALELCHRLGFATALVTSKTHLELTRFLESFKARRAVDVTVCSSDVEFPKPHPESALLACKRLGVQVHEAVLFGDSIFDIQCARQAGVHSVALGYGAATSSQLLDQDPDAFFETPSQLLDWVHHSLLQPSCHEKN